MNLKAGSKYKVLIPVLLFLFAVLAWRSPYYILSLYVAIPVIIISCFRNYSQSIFRSKYWMPYLVTILWVAFSNMFGENPDVGYKLFVPIFAGFLLSFSGYALAINNCKSYILNISYVALLLYLLYMNYSAHGMISFDYSDEQERHDAMLLNANDYAYYTLFATMSAKLFLNHFNNRINGIWILVIYLALSALSFYVALMTASRQVLTLQIPLLLFLFYYDFIKGKNINGIYALLIVVALVVMLPMAFSVYSDSYLATRSQVSFEEDSRSDLLILGINQGLDNPLFGLGLGANVEFTHCTYTHLFARAGFVAVFAYVQILFRAVINQLRYYKITNERTFILYLVFILFIVVGNFTYSYINEPFMMTILFIILGSSEKLYREYQIC